MLSITDDQSAFFEENGYILLKQAVSKDCADAASRAIWNELNMDAHRPDTWAGVAAFHVTSHPDVRLCVAADLSQVVDKLSGEANPGWSPPNQCLLVNTFPSEGPWRPNPPHIDHALAADNFDVFPRPMRLATLIYLGNVTEHAGGTVVWPGSHKQIQRLYDSDPIKYKKMAVLNRSIRERPLGEPIEVLADAGDVLLYHYLTAHAGSANTSAIPRFAIAYKW